MCFLIMDLGVEDTILGYPWPLTFEPKFNWRDSVIDTTTLPIVVRSLDWRLVHIRPTIATINIDNKDKHTIFRQLVEESTTQNISTDIAIQAKKHTEKVDVPKPYQ